MATNEQRHKISVEVKSAVASINSVTTAFDKQKKSFDKLQKTIKTFNKQYGKFVAGQARTVSNLDKVDNKAKAAGKAMSTTGKKAQTAGKQMAKAGKDAHKGWNLVAGLLASRIIQSAFGALTSTAKDSTTEFIKLNRKISEFQTISLSTFGKLGNDLEGIHNQIRDISNAFNIDQADVVEAQYQAISNQIAGAADNLSFLESAGKLSVVSVASLSDSVGILSSAINSFNLSSTRADQISGKLFKTVEKGRVRIEEMASDLGRSSALANQLGISLDELLASFATITIQGVKFANAQTFVTNIMLKLIKPTDSLAETFTRLGFSSSKAAIDTLGFYGVLRLLDKEFDKSANSLGELGKQWGSIRSIVGAAILGDNLGKAEANLAAITEANEDFQEAFQERFDNTGETITREFTKIKNFFITDFGGGIVNALSRIDKSAKVVFGDDGLSALLIKVAIPLATTVAAFITLKTVVNAAITKLVLAKIAATAMAARFFAAEVVLYGFSAAVASVNTALVLGPGAIIVAIGTALAAGAALWATWGESAKTAGEKAAFALEKINKETSKVVINQIDALNTIADFANRKALKPIQDRLAGIFKTLKANNKQIELMKKSLGKFRKISKDALETFNSGFVDARKEMEIVTRETNRFLDNFLGKLSEGNSELADTKSNLESIKDAFIKLRDTKIGRESLAKQFDIRDSDLTVQRNRTGAALTAGDKEGVRSGLKDQIKTHEQLAEVLTAAYNAGELGSDAYKSKLREVEASQVRVLESSARYEKILASIQKQENKNLGGGALRQLQKQLDSIKTSVGRKKSQLTSGGYSELINQIAPEFNALQSGIMYAMQQVFSGNLGGDQLETVLGNFRLYIATLRDDSGQAFNDIQSDFEAMANKMLEGTSALDTAFSSFDSLLEDISGKGIIGQAEGAAGIQMILRDLQGKDLSGFGKGLKEERIGVNEKKFAINSLLDGGGITDTERKQLEAALGETEATLKQLDTNIARLEGGGNPLDLIGEQLREKLGLVVEQDKASQEQKNLTEARDAAKKSLEQYADTLGELNTESIGIIKKFAEMNAFTSTENPFGYLTGGRLRTDEDKARTASREQYDKLFGDFSSSPNKDTATVLRDFLSNQPETEETKGMVASLNSLLLGFNSISATFSADARAAIELVATDIGITYQEALANAGLISVSLEATIGAQEATLSGFVNSMDNQIVPSLQGIAPAINAAATNLRNASAGNHLGGPIGYATGGGVGATDTIPAMLSPGEFVTKASSAKALGLGNLSYMNNFGKVPGKYRRGTVIQGFADGGEVSVSNTNTFNVGSSGNERVDARRMAQNINREVRRGTVEAAGKRRRPF